MPAERPLDEVAARTSFARFRVASIVEGIAPLVLVGIMTMRYVVFGGDAWFTSTSPFWEQVSSVWSPIHGLIYMVYVVLGFDLWMKMRWGLPRMLAADVLRRRPGAVLLRRALDPPARRVRSRATSHDPGPGADLTAG
ncbi:DUF3817 domain-containing protein [Brachybacterium sp. GPGPB12]|uniref:DUF3817 domain-containing protein n=1 Tax=Brachybacterium sp. GPGPB12 TaxID=3023517 RepID=UPI0031344C1C